MTIVSGPKYDFILTGTARKPGVKLNASVFDFGPCFVTSNTQPVTKVLEITNQDNEAIQIETDFEKKLYLDFNVIPGQVLMPEEKLEIPIMFNPREMRKYNEVIKLDFNGLHKIDVTVTGQGIPLNLDLKDPDQIITDLGIASVGADVTRTVPIINRSQKNVKFQILTGNSKAF